MQSSNICPHKYLYLHRRNELEMWSHQLTAEQSQYSWHSIASGLPIIQLTPYYSAFLPKTLPAACIFLAFELLSGHTLRPSGLSHRHLQGGSRRLRRKTLKRIALFNEMP